MSGSLLPDGLVERTTPIPPSRYAGPDLLPTPLSARTWGVWHFAALWVGMSVCIPTYMLAASMIASGLNWWQSLTIIVLGNAIALLRSLVACGWFGIQTWVGGLAISALLGSLWPAWLGIGGGERFMGHTVPE